MGRLTKYGNTSHENGVCCTHFMSKACKEVNGECSYGCKWEEEAWSKLAHYEDLEEQGRLIELPCAVGDTVYCYHIVRDNNEAEYEIFEGTVNSIDYKGKRFGLWINAGDYASHIYAGILGEHIFLTKEEAEAKLKKLEGVKE